MIRRLVMGILNMKVKVSVTLSMGRFEGRISGTMSVKKILTGGTVVCGGGTMLLNRKTQVNNIRVFGACGGVVINEKGKGENM